MVTEEEKKKKKKKEIEVPEEFRGIKVTGPTDPTVVTGPRRFLGGREVSAQEYKSAVEGARIEAAGGKRILTEEEKRKQLLESPEAQRIEEARERFAPEEPVIPEQELPVIPEQPTVSEEKAKQFQGDWFARQQREARERREITREEYEAMSPAEKAKIALTAGAIVGGVVAVGGGLGALKIAGKTVTSKLSVASILKSASVSFKASMKAVSWAIANWKKSAVIGYAAYKVIGIPEQRIMDIDAELQQMRETITAYPLGVLKGVNSPVEAVDNIDDDLDTIAKSTRDFNLYRKLDVRRLTRPKAGDQVMRRLTKLDMFLRQAREDVIILSANPSPANVNRITDYWTSMEIE